MTWSFGIKGGPKVLGGGAGGVMKPNDAMDNLHEYDENLVPATGFTMSFLAFLPVIWLPQDQISVSYQKTASVSQFLSLHSYWVAPQVTVSLLTSPCNQSVSQ